MEVNENYYGLKENWFPLGGTSSSAWQSQIPDDEKFKLANFLNNTQSALQSDIRNGGILGNAIYKASFEYSRILEDIQNQQESFLTLFETLYTSILENPINEDEALLKYTDRIVSLNSGRRAAYSKEYKRVLVACIQINEWRKQYGLYAF